MSNITAVIYHKADFDGICSRAVAEKYFKNTADYFGWDYEDPVPNLTPYSVVYIIDIRLPKDIMELNAHKIIWIDHHKSSIDSISKDIFGLRIDGVAACRLAYQWFFGNKSASKEDYVNRMVKEPLAVRLLGEYDIWDKRDSNVDIFQDGLGAEKNIDWERLLNDVDPGYVCRILGRGQAIADYLATKNQRTVRDRSFTIDWEGYKFLVLNTTERSSRIFDSGVLPEHDGCIVYSFGGNKWKFSIYGVSHKKDIDFSKVAVKYGGGGHKQACGFDLDKLPEVFGNRV